MMKKVNFSRLEKIPLNLFVNFVVVFYILFVLKRFKFSMSSFLEGVTLNNAIWLFPFIIIIKISLQKKFVIDKNLLVILLILFITSIIGVVNVTSMQQFLYAFLLFIIPIFFIFSFNIYDIKHHLNTIIKIILVLNIIYSILAIYASSNYAFLMSLLGNKIDQQYFSQYRASLMLGSSITVSYYLNITLPFCYLSYYKAITSKWRLISLMAIILNIFATLMLLSRLSFLISVFICFFYLLIVKKEKNSTYKKIFLSIFLIFSVIIAFNSLNLSRLFSGIVDESIENRIASIKLGVHIFKKHPIIGSGLGNYFPRIYSDKDIIVDNIFGLVDPHNLYIMILSEQGIMGLFTITLLFLYTIKKFKQINDKLYRYTSYMIIITLLLGGIGGSHLINEIDFSTIFWMYISIFLAISNLDNTKKGNKDEDFISSIS